MISLGKDLYAVKEKWHELDKNVTPRLNYSAWNEAYTVENRNKTYSSVLPYCRAKTSLSPSTTVSTPYFSRYLQTKIRLLKSADRRYEIVHCYDRIIDKTRHTNVFPRKGEKQYTMSVLSALNMPWPQSKSNINDDSTQRCNSSICVYFCSVHKNPKSNIRCQIYIVIYTFPSTCSDHCELHFDIELLVRHLSTGMT